MRALYLMLGLGDFMKEDEIMIEWCPDCPHPQFSGYYIPHSFATRVLSEHEYARVNEFKTMLKFKHMLTRV